VLLAAGLAPPAADVGHVEVVLSVDGRVLDKRTVDVDLDGRLELVLVVQARRPEGGWRREIRIHPLDELGLPSVEPAPSIPVLDDVVLWSLADLRPEPGREILFFTRTGMYSYSPTLPGYRNNIERVLEEDLLFDLADPSQLPYWEYVDERGGDPLLLVPSRHGMMVWTRGDDGAYARRGRIGPRGEGTPLDFGSEAVDLSPGDGVRVTIGFDDGGPFLDERPAAFSWLLSTDADYRAPAFLDLDGDGDRDALYRREDGIVVHLADAGGLPLEPTRIDPLEGPAFEAGGASMRFVDLDGDGDLDVLATRTEGERGADLEPDTHTLLVLRNDGGPLPSEPAQVLRFEAHEVQTAVEDLDGDGRRDLLVTTFRMPSLADVVSGFELRRTTLVYLAGDERPFARAPAVKDERIFRIEDLQDALVRRDVGHDLSGDGVKDLVEVDLLGHVTIRRLRRERGFFGGTSWTLEAAPWRRYAVKGGALDMRVVDLDGDGLGDVITGRRSVVSVLVSRGGADR